MEDTLWEIGIVGKLRRYLQPFAFVRCWLFGHIPGVPTYWVDGRETGSVQFGNWTKRQQICGRCGRKETTYRRVKAQ